MGIVWFLILLCHKVRDGHSRRTFAEWGEKVDFKLPQSTHVDVRNDMSGTQRGPASRLPPWAVIDRHKTINHWLSQGHLSASHNHRQPQASHGWHGCILCHKKIIIFPNSQAKTYFLTMVKRYRYPYLSLPIPLLLYHSFLRILTRPYSISKQVLNCALNISPQRESFNTHLNWES